MFVTNSIINNKEQYYYDKDKMLYDWCTTITDEMWSGSGRLVSDRLPTENGKSFLEFIKDLAIRSIIGKNLIKDFEEIRDGLKIAFQDQRNENLSLLLLDDNNNLSDIKLVSIGKSDCTLADPAVIIDELTSHQDGKNPYILLHNHPTGFPNPSLEDCGTTFRMMKALKPLGFEMIDHLIIGKGGLYSFAVSDLDQSLDPIVTVEITKMLSAPEGYRNKVLDTLDQKTLYSVAKREDERTR